MLERLKELPPEIEGLRAVGTVSREDYELVLEPILERARDEGRRIRFLYEIGAGFDGFTAGGAWADTRLGLRFLRIFEACAVVSDIAWIRQTARAVGFVLPCPVRVFAGADRDEAVRWLRSYANEAAVVHRLLTDRGIIVLEISRPLRAADFDALAETADDWIRMHGYLQGLVVHAREFPGWENLAGFVHHIRFIRQHHRKIQKVALAADTRLASVAPHIAEHFVEAEIRRFEYDELAQAIDWASTPRQIGKRAAAG
jgi:hypothetical protein